MLWPGSTGSRAAMAWAGVRWVLPAEGHEHGGRADGAVKPLGQAPAGRRTSGWRPCSRRVLERGRRAAAGRRQPGSGTVTAVCLSAPLVSRKARDRSAIVWPFQRHHHPGALGDHGHRVGLQVFRLAAAMKRVRVLRGAPPPPCAPGSRRWPARCRPGRRTSCAPRPGRWPGRRPARRWPRMTPPAPKSLHRLIMRVTSAVAEQALDLALLGGVALLHLGWPWSSRDFLLWLLEEPVAPPMPSRPVRPPSRMTTSPGAGRSRTTLSAGRGAHHRAAPPGAWPHSRRGRPRPHGRWPGRSGCRRRSSRRRRWWPACAGAACPPWSGHRGRGGRRTPVTRMSLIDIGPAGKRVADAAADAGGRAAEGLDLGGVVVGLVLEHEQPVLLLAVHRRRGRGWSRR